MHPPLMEETQTAKQKMCIPEKIRDKLKVEVVSHREEPTNMSPEGRKKLEKPVHDYKGLVVDEDCIGKLKSDPVHLDYNDDHKPQHPNIPHQYQDELLQIPERPEGDNIR